MASAEPYEHFDTMKEWVTERSGFLKEWIRAPLVTASIVPSSKSLGRAMVSAVDPDSGPVIELGPGTGVFTRCLLEHGVPEENLVLVEINHFFASQLRVKFPRARVIHGPAERLQDLGFEAAPRFAVSGIPLMSIPNPRVEMILRAVFQVMAADGTLVQFTYAPRCPVNPQVRTNLGLECSMHRLVVRNIPPAGVYHLQKCSRLR